MQASLSDQYLTMIELLAFMVKDHLSKPVQRFALAQVDEQTAALINALLDQEEEELAELELTAELLGTWTFQEIA